jgi:hypothetical protein
MKGASRYYLLAVLKSMPDATLGVASAGGGQSSGATGAWPTV